MLRTWRIVDWCTNKEELCYQYISVEDKTAPGYRRTKIWEKLSSGPHDCGTIDLDTLKVDDCSKVTQAYNLSILKKTKNTYNKDVASKTYLGTIRKVSDQCIIGG